MKHFKKKRLRTIHIYKSINGKILNNRYKIVSLKNENFFNRLTFDFNFVYEKLLLKKHSIKKIFFNTIDKKLIEFEKKRNLKIVKREKSLRSLNITSQESEKEIKFKPYIIIEKHEQDAGKDNYELKFEKAKIRRHQLRLFTEKDLFKPEELYTFVLHKSSFHDAKPYIPLTKAQRYANRWKTEENQVKPRDATKDEIDRFVYNLNEKVFNIMDSNVASVSAEEFKDNTKDLPDEFAIPSFVYHNRKKYNFFGKYAFMTKAAYFKELSSLSADLRTPMQWKKHFKLITGRRRLKLKSLRKIIYFMILKRVLKKIHFNIIQGEYYTYSNIKKLIYNTNMFKEFRRIPISRPDNYRKLMGWSKSTEKENKKIHTYSRYIKYGKVTYIKARHTRAFVKVMKRRSRWLIRGKKSRKNKIKLHIPRFTRVDVDSVWLNWIRNAPLLKGLKYLWNLKIISYLFIFTKLFDRLGVNWHSNEAFLKLILTKINFGNYLFLRRFVCFFIKKIKSKVSVMFPKFLHKKLFYIHRKKNIVKKNKSLAKFKNRRFAASIKARTKMGKNFNIKTYMIKFFNSFVKKGKKNIIRNILFKIVKILKFIFNEKFNVLLYFKQIFFKVRPLMFFKKLHLGKKNLNLIPFFADKKFASNWDANRRLSRIGTSWLINGIKRRKEKTLLLRIINEFVELQNNTKDSETLIIKKEFYLNFYKSKSYERLLKFVTWV